MNLTELDGYLEIVDGTLTLAADTIPDAGLGDLLTEYNGGQPLVIENARKESGGDAVRVDGTASFMNIADLPVHGVFTVDAEGEPELCLRFELIGERPDRDGWLFSKSFPMLPYFSRDKVTSGQPENFLDTLLLSNTAFLLTNAAGTDDATGAPLVVGLNFVSDLDPTGAIGLFESLLPERTTCLLYGSIDMPTAGEITPLPSYKYPWQTAWKTPGITLQAGLLSDYAIAGSELTFEDWTLRIFCPTEQEWLERNPDYGPTVAVSGVVGVPSAGLSVELTARVGPTHRAAWLGAQFEGFSLENLAQLADAAGGEDLFDYLPADLQQYGEALGGIRLTAMTVVFGAELVPTAIHLTVGMPNLDTTILEFFTVESLMADFTIAQPFASGQTVSVELRGTLEVCGTPFEVSIETPSNVGRATMADAVTLPLSDLFDDLGLPAPTDLTIQHADMTIVPGYSYAFETLMADDPHWTLDLGVDPMEIGGVQMRVTQPASGGAQGSFGGAIQFSSDIEIAMQYDLPGEFILRAEFEEVKLSELIERLDEIGIPLPSGFDFDFHQTWVQIEQHGADYTFTASTSLEGVGQIAFSAQKMGKWGYAAGFDLDTDRMADIPGCGALAAFEDFVGLEQLMLVASSLADPGFEFPSMVELNAPGSGNGQIKLPPQAGGLTQGVNFYAQINAAKNQALQALANWLGLKLDGSLGVALAVSCPDPAVDSRLFLSIDTTVNGVAIDGTTGGILQGGEVGVFLTGTARANVQGQPMTFDLTLLVLANGLMISGGYRGTIRFDPLPVQLSNLGIEIGMNWEGVPSFGFTATLDVESFESSIAIFLDSVDPAKSMFAGAVDGLTLADVAKTLSGQKDLGPLDATLSAVGLRGFDSFDLDAATATALDNRDIAALSAAFAAQGVPLPSGSDGVLLVINEAESVWHVTDLVNQMRHYRLAAGNGKITVQTQPQIYCVPVDTWIGAVRYPQGFFVEAGIDFLGIHCRFRALISAGRGVSVDAEADEIVIYHRSFCSISASNGSGGPRLSLATFTDPAAKDPELKDPHFLLSGKVRLLGADFMDIYCNIGVSSIEFRLAQKVYGVEVELDGSVSGPSASAVAGGLSIVYDETLDLGGLGRLKVETRVEGRLAASFNGREATASATHCRFELEGVAYSLPTLQLSTDNGLVTLFDTVWDEMVELLEKTVTDPEQWLKWLEAGLIAGVESAEEVGRILDDVFGLPSDEIAELTEDLLGYDADAIAAALKGAGAAADEIVHVLDDMGIPTNEINDVLDDLFPGSHTDTNLGHMDIPKVHTDSKTLGVHTDITWSKHSDSKTHIDLS